MRRRDFIAFVGSVASTAATPALAQVKAMPTVGFLNPSSPARVAPLVEAFRDALAKAGYVEGHTVAIEYRWAEGNYDRLKPLAMELAKRNVAVIAATGGTVAAKAAQAATSKIPILFIAGFDPVQEGLVDSINRPGTNATGVGVYTAQLGPKRLEMLLRVVHRGPIAMLTNPKAISTKAELEDARQFASGRNVELIELSAASDNEIELKIAEAALRGATGILVSADALLTSHSQKIVTLATTHKIPGSFPWPQYVHAGGLMSYGPDLVGAYREIGGYAARILKGSKPSELPVQFPTKFQTLINEKAATK
jgi:putative ABC transport system substrate-binding protein